MRSPADQRPVTVADLETCTVGNYLALWADLPPAAARPTEADPQIAARLAPRGLQPAIDDVGVVAVHTDEAEKMIAALARRAGKLAERIAEADGDDPASCKEAGDYVAFKVLLKLWDLPLDELRRRAALLDR